MKKENNQKKNYKATTFVYLFPLAGLVKLGLMLTDYYFIFLIISLCILLGWLIIARANLQARKAHKEHNTNYLAMKNMLSKDTQKIKGNSDKYFANYRLKNLFAALYFIMFNLSMFFIILTCITLMALTYYLSLLVACAFCAYQIYVLTAFFAKHSTSDIDKFVLDLNEYPKLEKIVRNSLNIMKLKIYDKLIIFAASDINFSVTKIKNKFYLAMSSLALRTLDEKELTAVLIHEFAHIANKDLDKTKYIGKVDLRWNALAKSRGGRLFFARVNFLLGLTAAKYLHAISIDREKLADDNVHKNNYSEHFNTSVTKMYMVKIYQNIHFKESLFKTYKEMPDLILEKEFQEFVKAYEQRKDTWIKMIGTEISYDLDTHPLLAARLSTKDYSNLPINFQKIEEDLLADYMKLFEKFQKKIDVEQWEIDREVHFVVPKKIVEIYEKNGKAEKIGHYSVGLMYLKLGNKELALKAFECALKEKPDYAFALYHKAIIMLDQGEIEALDMLSEAVSLDEDLAEEVLKYYMTYANLYGLNEKLEEFEKKHSQLIYNEMLIKDVEKHEKYRFKSGNLDQQTKARLRVLLRGYGVQEAYVANVVYDEKVSRKVLYVRILWSSNVFSNVIMKLSLENNISMHFGNFRMAYGIYKPVTKIRGTAIIKRTGNTTLNG